MASTYSSLLYHLVFGTKSREPWILPAWRGRLHEYLGGTMAGLGGVSQGVGGVADHVHLLIGLKPSHCLSDVVRELKKASSAWVHDTLPCPAFSWQEGYAAFTISVTSRGAIRAYIANQEEHHRLKSYREELEAMLKKAGIKCDPRYMG
jgi:REP element-mobilizing transposase RayT